MNYDAHYDPIYNLIGVDGVLHIGTASFPIRVIDKTMGIEQPGEAAVQEIRPAACVRAKQVTSQGLTLADLDGASITFNSQTWIISSVRPRPAPTGEGEGELLLWLYEAAG